MSKILVDIGSSASSLDALVDLDVLKGNLEQLPSYEVSFLLFVSDPQALVIKQKIRTVFPHARLHYFNDVGLEGALVIAKLLAYFMRDREIEILYLPCRVEDEKKTILESAASLSNVTFVKGQVLPTCAHHLPKNTTHIAESVGRVPLAIVAPYPPLKTGIADYVAGLLPYLAAWYDIILVVPDNFPERESIRLSGKVVSESEFLTRTEWHQRVVYQLGNSPFHLTALDLLEKIPGVVVLHDIHFGDVRIYQQEILGIRDIRTKSLGQAHGSKAIISLSRGEDCTAIYPCNLPLLQDATAVMVHSEFAKSRITEHFAPIVERRLNVIPFYKTISVLPDQGTKVTYRATLGLDEGQFVVSTFGYCTPLKQIERLIEAWCLSRFHNAPNAVLLIAGEFIEPQYEQRIQAFCSTWQISNIRFVGYTDQDMYQKYLGVTDLAVQLRASSRGETSAAVMDCMAAGVPVIANTVGSILDLPDESLWKIPAACEIADLLTALEFLHEQPQLRQRMGGRGRDYIVQNCQPAHVALCYRQVIEKAQSTAEVLRERKLVKALADQAVVADAQRLAIARAIVSNRQPLTKQQLLIDVTAIVHRDLKTGIQRVVRSLLAEFYQATPPGYRIEPVYLDHNGCYRYAWRFLAQQQDLSDLIDTDPLAQVSAGDIYFGVDMHKETTTQAREIYQHWRARGVRVTFVLYDLLPVQHPEWFPPEVHPDFIAWLETLLSVSDGILAISQTVAEELKDWMRNHPETFSNPVPVQVGWFHLGSDIAASLPTRGLPENAPQTLAAIVEAPSFLMVSTVEPRKGHRQALAAFECLWSRGISANLVIVGKHGWMVDQLVDQIKTHPEYGHRLFWLESISDEYLEQIYPRCTALLAASEGEGFGLPIIEAAQHQIPIIARDIPVFREVGGTGVSYFQDDSPEALADYLTTWLQVSEKPDPVHVQRITWAQSAQQALNFLLD